VAEKYKLIPLAILLLSLFVPSLNASTRGNQKVKNFRQAKKLMVEVYKDHRTTFYCDCEYENKKISTQTCGYIPKKNRKGRISKRAFRLEWEHVTPAQVFGRSFPEWKRGHSKCQRKGKSYKGRKCVRKASLEFRRMEADLYNLVPAIGQINGLRSNYSFAMIEGEAREFGACDFEIRSRKTEPKPDIRGDIARTYFYMEWAYPNRGIVSRKNRKLFEAWNKQDPVDQWERVRAGRIERLQGNTNPFIVNQ
jgi:deoxyribonuclease-1